MDAQAQSEGGPSPLVRKSTPFLSPLAAILRARYPSSIVRPSINVVAEVPEPTVEEESIAVETSNDNNMALVEDAEAKVTAEPAETMEPLTPKANENGNAFEKLGNNNMDRSSSPPITSVS